MFLSGQPPLLATDNKRAIISMLQQIAKWGSVGALLGAGIGFFFYQKTPPRFESRVVLGFKTIASPTDDTPRNLTPSEAILLPEVLAPALQSAGLEPLLATGKLSDESVSAFLADKCFKMEALPNTVDGETLRITYQSGLSSTCQNFMKGLIASVTENFQLERSLPVTEDYSSELMSVKVHSDNRIRQLKSKLIELPSNPEVRWTENGLVSPNTLLWDGLQVEADQLHRRKAMLRERLLEIKAMRLAEQIADPAGATGQEPAVMEIDEIANLRTGLISDLSPVTAVDHQQKTPQEGKLTEPEIALRTDYLQKQIDLIFEQHLVISQKMRALARDIDFEEQVAFEVYSLRKELEQEFTIRERLFGKLRTAPPPRKSFPFVLDVIGSPSKPVQVEPRLALHLWNGAAVGATLLMMATGFVLAVGVEEKP